MCGICGIAHFDKERDVDHLKLENMTKAILHRGPDGHGYYVEQNIGLGHRRLSIIDLHTGDQPMYSSDGNQVLVFNGEIYNYLELTKTLTKLGHNFKTHSDTEVIINAYKQWGLECHNKFNGMWSFALWDKQKQLLLLSRDRIGEKPLYYTIQDNTLVFGSEIKSLIPYGIQAKPCLELLELYLYLGFIPAPYTYYKGIKKLSAGSYVVLRDGKLIEGRYWNLPDVNESDLNTDKEYIEKEFLRLFKDSINLRMRSDVPFGAFLSGGLDSASIVSVMSDISNIPVETFTIGFKEKNYDERKLARQVAEMNETKHHEQIVEPSSFENSINKILYHYDEPFSDPAAIPTSYLAEYARKNVKMVLTGDGGDEVLSGYRAFRGEKFASQYRRSPSFFRYYSPKIISRISQQFSGDMRYKLNRIQKILVYAEYSFLERILIKNSLSEPYTPKDLIVDKCLSIEDYFEEVLTECRFNDPFYKLMFLQFKVYLPDQMLVKVDRMAMAHSLETRIPFLDHRLVETLYLAHKNIKLPGYRTKSILRNTFKSNLPKSVLNAPKKGFNVPLREWFKKSSFNDSLDILVRTDMGLNNNLLQKIVRDNKLGIADNGNFLYRLIVYGNWLARINAI